MLNPMPPNFYTKQEAYKWCKGEPEATWREYLQDILDIRYQWFPTYKKISKDTPNEEVDSTHENLPVYQPDEHLIMRIAWYDQYEWRLDPNGQYVRLGFKDGEIENILKTGVLP